MVSLQEILKTQTETVLEEAEKQKMSTSKYDKARSVYFRVATSQNSQLKYRIKLVII